MISDINPHATIFKQCFKNTVRNSKYCVGAKTEKFQNPRVPEGSGRFPEGFRKGCRKGCFALSVPLQFRKVPEASRKGCRKVI